MTTRRALLLAALVSLTGGLGLAADPKLTFEVYADRKDEFRWRLKTDADKILATSGQGYAAKRDCKKGAERIKADADKLNFEVYEDRKKEHRFRIKAANGQVIGASNEGYPTKADAEKVVEVIKKGAKDADVVEK
jgi:uncharacterized protein YegP (UPF0339 family)